MNERRRKFVLLSMAKQEVGETTHGSTFSSLECVRSANLTLSSFPCRPQLPYSQEVADDGNTGHIVLVCLQLLRCILQVNAPAGFSRCKVLLPPTRPQAPNRQHSYNTGEIIGALASDEDVAALRNSKSADLVVLVIHSTSGALAGA